MSRWSRYDVQNDRDFQRRLARILIEVGEEAPAMRHTGTAGGDERKLRGIPAVARGVPGAIPGTNPLAALVYRSHAPRA